MKIEMVITFASGDESWKIVDKDEIPRIIEEWLDGETTIKIGEDFVSSFDSKGREWIKDIRIQKL